MVGVMIKKRILIADDDAFYRRRVGEVLQANGISATIVDSGVALVKEFIAQPHEYFCVITDIHMEAMSGLEAASMIRNRFEDIPIIMMTGDDCMETEMHARAIGISYYLKKPFGEHELMAVLRAVMSAGQNSDGKKDHVENSYY